MNDFHINGSDIRSAIPIAHLVGVGVISRCIRTGCIHAESQRVPCIDIVIILGYVESRHIVSCDSVEVLQDFILGHRSVVDAELSYLTVEAGVAVEIDTIRIRRSGVVSSDRGRSTASAA